MTPPSPRRLGSRSALAATVGGLAAANVVRSTLVPPRAHLALNIGLAGAVAAGASAAGLTASEVGLGRDRLAGGLRWGAAATGAVTAASLAASTVPAAAPAFRDARADVSPGRLLYDVGVRIPLGTVVLEELAFRGAVLGLASRLVAPRTAILGTSLLFGLWHALPAARSAAGVDGGDRPDRGERSPAPPPAPATSAPDAATPVVVAGAVVGTVAATTAAGIAFCGLRLRSGSLVAPALAHLATNTVPLAVAWGIRRRCGRRVAPGRGAPLRSAPAFRA